MLWVNKTLKALAYFAIRVLSAMSLAFLALLVTSPAVLLVISVLDIINRIPSFMQGRYLICWLIVSAPFFIGFNIYTDYRVNKPRRELKDNKKSDDDK